MVRAGVIGASGYSGLELIRLLARHGDARVVFATSDRWQGKPVEHARSLSYVGNAEGVAAAAGCDVVFLATPAETSLELVPKLRATSARIVDLSGSFRLGDLSQYPKYYGFEHHAAALVKEAAYGLPELFRAQVKGATLVANPGCYATAAALSVAPLLRAGLIEADGVVVTAASGVSGAGRKATEDFSFMEIDSDFRPYRTLRHQHTPEIDQTLSRVAGKAVTTVFTPHLLPVKRGIVSTAVARLVAGVTPSAVQEAFATFAAEPLISLVSSPDAVRLADVVHTARCSIGAATDGKHVVVSSALDNLLKGAASQAVQNMNLLFGLPETQGLL